MLKRRDGRWSSPLTYAAISRKNEDFEICLMTRRFTFFFFWVRSLSKTITISEEFQDLYAHYEKKRHFCSLLLRYFFIQLREKRRRRTTFEIDDGWTRTSWSSPSRIWNLTPNAGLRAKRSGDLQLWICQISSKNEVIFHLYVRRSK